MVSLDQSYTMLPKHMGSEHDDYILYPEPPQGVFGSTPMEMAVPADASYMYPTSMAMDAASLYDNNFMYQGRTSPGLYEDADFQLPSSNLSIASAPSAASSNVGSPQSQHDQPAPIHDWAHPGIAVTPGIVPHDYYNTTGTEYSTYGGPGMEDFAAFDFANTKPPGFVDPSLIHPDISRPMAMNGFHHNPNQYPASPALSASSQSMVRNGSQSPFLHNGFQQQQHFSPYATPADARRPSLHSFPSTYSDGNNYSGDEGREKQRCPHPECGKTFKDLKAHMLTHQNERPEKCPIVTCDYHVKGFARKYDKNRHTLTHYKGTMVCGFCPGSGSAAEKSFNRADVFKRHLTAVHGVEQTPPNSRKKSTGTNSGKKLAGYPPDATGKCSTCSQTFSNAQDFYEHLDDCVLRIVQQEDPSEAINAKRLAEVEDDKEVHQTLEKNHLPTQTQMASTGASTGEDEDDEDMVEDEDEEDSKPRLSSPSKRKGNPVNGVQKSRGLTHSRGGAPMLVKAKGRKNRRDYPSSWGFDKGQMTMKKRVMAVFDGPRRLAKDDMMLSTDHEVRVKLSDGNSYVTDLDMQTLKRAEGFLGATEEEKGPWISDDPTEEQIRQMHEMLESCHAAQ